MTAPAVDVAPAVDTDAELKAARAESGKADAVLAAAKQRVVDAQAAAAQLQRDEGELVLGGSKTLTEAGAVLAAAMATVDAARSHVAAAERAARAARARENACFASHLRQQAAGEDATDARQRAEAGALAQQHMERDGRLSYQLIFVENGPQSGLIEQATRAQSVAFQLAEK